MINPVPKVIGTATTELFLTAIMKQVFTTFGLLMSLICGVISQETFPVNGVYDVRHTQHAFINAKVYVTPDLVLDSATLLIKDGKVVSVGKTVVLPADAVIHDCKGRVIYPSFIDIYSGLNVSKKGKSNESSAAIKKEKAGNWNDAIHPEEDVVIQFPLDNKKSDDWMGSGFGVVNLHNRDGIMRGTSSVVLLGQKNPNEAVVKRSAANHLSFSKGTSTDDYPSSFMGAIALLRQTYYDAQWYATLQGVKKEVNPSLEAINNRSALPNIIELNHSLSVRNVEQLEKEFGKQFLMVGVGKEYLALQEMSTTTRMIVPLNFPKALDVEDPFLARMSSLEELKHWEAAPFNPMILSENEVQICLTRDTIASSKEFLKNLKKAIDCGLSHDEALKALTIQPAKMLNINANYGSLEQGKVANFIIANGRIDEEDFYVESHWTRGVKVFESDPNYSDMIGVYNLVVDGKDFELKVLPTTGKEIKTDISSALKSDKLKATVKRDGELLAILIQSNDSAAKVLFQLTGKISFNGGVWDGRGQNAKGEWISWAAIKDRKVNLKGDPKKPQESQERPQFTHPNVAYGWDSLSNERTFIITNATVWTATDAGTLEHADIHVVDGVIKFVGTGSLFPDNIKRINANGKHVTPGIVDEHSHIGIRGGVNEGAQSSSAEVRIADAIDPWNINIYRQLGGGITTAQLLHGSANPIGGQSALIKLKWGESAEEMLIDDAPKFIKFALGENVKRSNSRNPKGRFPLTRMGVEQSIADVFIRASEYRAPDSSINTEKSVKKGGEVAKTTSRRDLELDVIKEILNEQRYITCHSYVQSEILMLMALGDSLGFKVNTFTHILEGYKVSEEMRLHGANASTFSDWWAYKYEVNDAIPYNAAMLTKAGVNTGINSDDAEMGRRLNQEAAKAMKYGGLSPENAIKLITINPAKMLHLDDKIGSVEAGKSADLVIWSGNPLSVYSHAEKTFIEGKLYFDYGKLDVEQQRIQQERSRLIQSMIMDKSSSKKTPKHKEEKHMHCDTVLDNYIEE